MQNLRQIIKELLAHKMRLLLTIFAIAWGTASISGMLSIGEGLRQTFVKSMTNSGPGLLIINGNESSRAYQGTPPGTWIKLSRQDLQDIKKTLPQIKTIAPLDNFSAKVSFLKNGSYFNAPNAVTSSYAKLKSIAVAYPGRFINYLDVINKRRVVVLGDKIASELFKHGTNPLQNYINIGGWKFKVIGVSKKKIEFTMGSMPASYQLWIPISTYQALTNQSYYDSFLVLAHNPSNNPALLKEITNIIAKNHGVSATDPQIISNYDLYTMQSNTNDFMIGMQVFLGIIGSITLLVAGIGIANVIYASVYQSTRQIGIQIAIGARTSHIVLHYLIEALIVTIIGGVIGILITLFLIFIASHINFHSQFADMLGNPKPILSVPVLISVIILLGLMGIISGFFPALKASRIQPAEALRYE